MSAPASSPRPAADRLPPAYRGSRGELLVELKRSGRVTARQLSVQLGLSLNAVRHHLKELEAEGLVVYTRQQHGGVGAPVFEYQLSPAGEALFPQRYRETLDALLDHVVKHEGRAAAVAFLEAHYDTLAERLAPELEGAAPAERMAIVARARNDDGYMAEGQATFCCGTLTEHHCAIRAVSERFPEVCAAEERFLGAVLGAKVERKLHLLGGDAACQYRVQFGNPDSAETA